MREAVDEREHDGVHHRALLKGAVFRDLQENAGGQEVEKEGGEQGHDDEHCSLGRDFYFLSEDKK